jgi:hypothetical protein
MTDKKQERFLARMRRATESKEQGEAEESRQHEERREGERPRGRPFNVNRRRIT